nr:lytic transglycosylase domain-containing protein [Roseomonas sp. GC11]
MLAVAQVQGLPPRVLPVIQAIEGGAIGMVRGNSNGSEDLGLMQVNTVWLGPLSRGTGLPQEEVRRRLVEDGCFAITVAGAILRMHLTAEKGDLMKAIGNYHSRTPALNEAYQARALAMAGKMFPAAP